MGKQPNTSSHRKLRHSPLSSTQGGPKPPVQGQACRSVPRPPVYYYHTDSDSSTTEEDIYPSSSDSEEEPENGREEQSVVYATRLIKTIASPWFQAPIETVNYPNNHTGNISNSAVSLHLRPTIETNPSVLLLQNTLRCEQWPTARLEASVSGRLRVLWGNDLSFSVSALDPFHDISQLYLIVNYSLEILL
jgi:hypothetical protein